MSPSESQLRAALSDGEGPGPDPDAIIGRALQIRVRQRERRVRVLAAVGAVVVVGGIGVGIAASGGGSHTTASSPGEPRAASLPAASVFGSDNAGLAPVPSATAPPLHAAGGAGGAGGPVGNINGASGGVSCPATPVSYALAGGGGTNQFGASQPLVSAAVASLTFCSYDATSTAATYQGSRVLEGATAQQWIDGANASTVSGDPLLCLAPRRVEILVVDTGGNALTPLSVTGECQYAMVTNGTSVRYVKLSVLDGVIDGTHALATPPPSGEMSGGSPPR